MNLKKLSFCVVVFFNAALAYGASVEKAEMFNEHGLNGDAKRELIDVIFSGAEVSVKAEALYFLGSIAFEEKRVSTALGAWKTLVAKYPTSSRAKLVKDKIAELAEIVGESADEALNNAVAQSYLRHADFWSKGKDSIFRIDSSWIPNVEAAVKWYDKVIEEFPKSVAAERAYKGKLRALIGWKESGRHGSSHGVKGDFDKYIPQLLSAFSSYEKEFPKAGSLQAFRYQIAQIYWSNKDWALTRQWLNKIIEVSGETESFYKDLAKRRLKKIEY